MAHSNSSGPSPFPSLHAALFSLSCSQPSLRLFWGWIFKMGEDWQQKHLTHSNFQTLTHLFKKIIEISKCNPQWLNASLSRLFFLFQCTFWKFLILNTNFSMKAVVMVDVFLWLQLILPELYFNTTFCGKKQMNLACRKSISFNRSTLLQTSHNCRPLRSAKHFTNSLNL